METAINSKFKILFFFLLIAELLCGSIDRLSSVHYFTKPSILMALIIYFFIQSKSISTKMRIMTLAALSFSLSGDILLMFVDQSANYFMLGLVSFLLAHVFYIVIFLMRRNPEINPSAVISILILYAIGLFYLLNDRLVELLIPVIIYMLVILIMVITAFLRQRKVSQKSFILVFLGAILFVISDSILALNKFYMPLKFSGLTIMLTYGLAQFFIVRGLLKQR